MGTSPKAAGTDLCTKTNRFWLPQKVQIGAEMSPMVETFMRSFSLVESAVVCLSSHTEILMEKPTGSFYPLAYFSSLEEDRSCQLFAILLKESKRLKIVGE